MCVIITYLLFFLVFLQLPEEEEIDLSDFDMDEDEDEGKMNYEL